MKGMYKQIRKEAVALNKKCLGVMIILMLMFYIVKNMIVYPIIEKIWGLALSTLPTGFITNANAKVFLTHPYLLLIGLLVVVIYCIMVVWELSAIMLCFAYYDQDRPVSLFRLLYLSLFNIKHLAKRKNWLFFVYILVILPFTDMYSASGMVSSIAMPEYIKEYILNTPILTVLVAAAYIALLWLTVRWFYAMQGVLICGKDFGEARKDSTVMIKGRMIRQMVEFGIYALLRFLKIILLPFVIILAIFMVSMALTEGVTGQSLAIKLAYYGVFYEAFKLASDLFLRMAIMSYLVVAYRIVATEKGLYKTPDLPEKGDKKGRIHLFKHLWILIWVGVTAACLIVFLSVLGMANFDPDWLDEYKGTAQIAAHKGLSMEAPENTMDSFEKAHNTESVDLIEFDVRESKDGIPIVIHNDNLKVACGVDESVYDLDYSEIRELTASYNFEDSEYPDAYIPTLEEVIATYGGKGDTLLIEIKADSRTPDLPKKVVDLIHKYNIEDDCVIQSGSYEALEAVKKEDSSIPCGFIIAMSTGNYYDLPAADFFSVEHNFVNTDMIDKIHQLGKKVYVWTVDEEESIEDVEMLDADVLITDYPDLVHDEIYSNNDMIDNVRGISNTQGNRAGQAEGKETYEEGDY